jgi:hypothetical protein
MTRLLAPLVIAVALIACGGDNGGITLTPRASSTVSIETTAAATSPANTTPTATGVGTPLPAATGTIATATAAPAVSGTGVSGVALVGPTCPVQRLDDACADKPWQGIVVARSLSGSDAGRAMTDAEGRFSIQLQPGTYLVVTLTSGVLPAPASAQITVVTGQMTQLELILDSGIR